MRACDVVVVGGGPVGVFSALILGRQGLRVCVLERGPPAPYWAPRAVALDSETVRLTHLAGLRRFIQDHIWKHSQAEVAAGFGLYSSSPGTGGWLLTPPPLVGDAGAALSRAQAAASMRPLLDVPIPFHQPTCESHMRRVAEAMPNVTILYDHEVVSVEVNPEGVAAHTVKGGSFAGQYMLVADGGSSRTRAMLGIEYAGNTFPDQPWIVLDCECEDEEYLKESWIGRCGTGFVVDPLRPFVFVRTPLVRNGHTLHSFRFELLLNPEEDKEEMVGETAVRRLLMGIGVDPDRVVLSRAVVYTFHARRASHWSKGNRLFLLGDAAHCMPPFQGQGLNSGLRDAGNLCWKLGMVLRKAAQPSVLASYEMERRKNLEDTIAASVKLGNVVMVRSPVLASLRNMVVYAAVRLSNAVLLRSPGRFRKGIGALLPAKPAPRLGRSGLVTRSPLAGTLLPYAFLEAGVAGAIDQEKFVTEGVWAGGAGTLDDVVSTESLTFLGLVAVRGNNGSCIDNNENNALETYLSADAKSYLSKIRATRICLRCNVAGEIMEWCKANGNAPMLLVVRPDHYILGEYALQRADDAVQQVKSMLEGKHPIGECKL